MKHASVYFLFLTCLFYSISSFSSITEASFEEGFIAGTLVSTSDGYKPIESVVVEDTVIGCDARKKIILSTSCQHVAQYIKILLENETIYAGLHQKFYDPKENVWVDAQNLISSQIILRKLSEYIVIQGVEIIQEPADMYSLTVEDHSFHITPNDVCVHNSDIAYECAGVLLTLGRVFLKHPALEIIGTLIDVGRAYSTIPQHLKNLQEMQSKLNWKGTVNFSEERIYYEYMLASLCQIRDDLLKIKRNFERIALHRWHGESFTSAFLQLSPIDTLCTVSATQEQSYNDEQKSKLRNMRQAHLDDVQRQIWELQISLALHFNELVDQCDQIKEETERQAKIVKGLAHEWDKIKPRIPYKQAVVHYENECLLDALLQQLGQKSQELRCVIEHYSHECNTLVLKRTTNIMQLAIQEIPNLKKIEAFVIEQKKINTQFKNVSENYFQQQRGTSVGSERNKATSKAKKHLEEKKAAELTQAKNKRGSIQPPEDPEKDRQKKQDSKIEFLESNIHHILNDRPGHLPDTPGNRKLLIDLVSDTGNFLGPDQHGTLWYGKTLRNGKQLWASVRDNLIRNGGLNETPNTYNNITGLCRLTPPR